MQTSMATANAISFDILNPTEETVLWGDIAHHLACGTRFCGGLREPYSIAQHCMLVHHILHKSGADDTTCLLGLLHDAEEAIFGDVITPVSNAVDALMPGAKAVMSGIKDKIRRVICLKAGISAQDYDRCMPTVHNADMQAYRVERRDLSLVLASTIDEGWDLPDCPEGISVNVVMDWREAKELFIDALRHYRVIDDTQLVKVA